MGDSPKLHSTHPDKPPTYSNKICRTSTRALREAAGRAEGGEQLVCSAWAVALCAANRKRCTRALKAASERRCRKAVCGASTSVQGVTGKG